MAKKSYTLSNSASSTTIQEFIDCQDYEAFNYNNLSFNELFPDTSIQCNVYNVVSDYLDEIRDNFCKKITMSLDELDKYIYRPKLLCYDIYNSSELYYLILLINDMIDEKEFNKRDLYLPTVESMKTIKKYIYSSNRKTINAYNTKNNKTT